MRESLSLINKYNADVTVFPIYISCVSVYYIANVAKCYLK